MSGAMDIFVDQMKSCCKITGAKWAVLLNWDGSDWVSTLSYGIKKAQEKELVNLLGKSRFNKWLDKSIENNKIYSRKIIDGNEKLECERLFSFPTSNDSRIMIVGVDQLEKRDKEIFKVLSMGIPLMIQNGAQKEFLEVFSSFPNQPFLYPSENLQKLLEIMIDIIPADAAYLAIRVGDEFRVEAATGVFSDEIGNKIPLSEDSSVYKIVESRQGKIISNGDQSLGINRCDNGSMNKEWLGIPIVLGTRVIGLIACSHKYAYSENELNKGIALANYVAPSIEYSMILSEAAKFLHRFALLNELSLVSPVGSELEDVFNRIRHMLMRTFSADRVVIYTFDSDRKYLLKDDLFSGKLEQLLPLESTIEGAVVKTGQPICIGNIANHSEYSSNDDEMKSKLATPFRFMGSVIGVLLLESKEENAFSAGDEKLLTVVASQIANIIENVKLSEESRERAHYFLQINEIVQRIMGLNQVSEIADLAAQLMAERFGYEMVLVMLLDDVHQELVAEGVAGAGTEEVPRGFRYARDLGVPGDVLNTGESVLLRQAAEAENYFPLPGWEPGSEMCVPLRDGEKIFGVINVEYQTPNYVDNNDLLVLNATAGALSSVILYARRYQQLQTNVRQLEAVRETALDLGKDLDLGILMKRVVNRVRELVDARGAELGLVDEKRELVHVLVSENPWQDYTGYSFPLMSGVAGRVAALGEPLTVADFNSWRGKSETSFKAPFTTVAAVPLKLSGEVIGTLSVQDDRPLRSFSSEDIQTLELLAPQLSIFIRNARLYRELEERIEAQRLAEERLIRSAKMAAVGEMAAAVAHELNNPLTTVTGFTELILESISEDSPEYKDLSLVLKEAQRSRSVVRRLLDFSRQGEILHVETDINEIISAVLALVHHVAQTSDIEIRVEMWDDLPLISIDRNQIQQVFLNLIHNGIQAMPDGGELLIQTQLALREDGEWIGVLFTDSGEGIKKENIDKIFEPFFTTKPSGEGTGLGLSVSYNIVSEHGGYIDVESREGEGAIFSVWLPVNGSEEKERD